jgi:hypothetical protein
LARTTARRLVELGDRIGNLEVENLGRFVQALAVLAELEDLAVIGAHALEHGGGVMQPMAQHVEARIAPRNEFAVEPDKAVTLVVRDGKH